MEFNLSTCNKVPSKGGWSREQANQYALSIGLNPNQYSRKDQLCQAIQQTLTGQGANVPVLRVVPMGPISSVGQVVPAVPIVPVVPVAPVGYIAPAPVAMNQLSRPVPQILPNIAELPPLPYEIPQPPIRQNVPVRQPPVQPIQPVRPISPFTPRQEINIPLRQPPQIQPQLQPQPPQVPFIPGQGAGPSNVLQPARQISFAPVSFPIGKLVTVKDLIEYKDNTKSSYLNYEKQNSQDKFEERYLERHPACEVSRVNQIELKIDDLNTVNIKNLLDNNFYDPEVVKTMLCLSSALFILPNSTINQSNQVIKTWIRNLQRIGSDVPSIQGMAFRTDFDNVKDVFVVKVPLKDDNTITHEFVVGLQLNELRSIVPNFVYTFGLFDCSGPVLNRQSQVVSYCYGKERIRYLLIERINPGTTYRNYMATCTFNQFLSTYLQVLYALSVANSKFGYTHYDLHDQNVLLRKLPGKTNIVIPYTTENKQVEYLESEYIATIIDYGLSFIILKDGTMVGDNLRPHVGAQLQTFPLHDAYKLYMFSVEAMYNSGNTACFDQAKKIFTFFDTTDKLEDAFLSTIRIPHFIIPTKDNLKITIFDLTRWIRQQFPTPFMSTTPQNNNIVSCRTGQSSSNLQCYSQDQVDTLFRLDKIVSPATIYDFGEVYRRYVDKINSTSRTTKRQYQQELNQFLQAVDIHHIEENIVYEATQLANQFNQIFAITQFVHTPTRITITYLSDENNRRSYFDNFYRSAELMNLTARLDYLQEITDNFIREMKSTGRGSSITGNTFNSYLNQGAQFLVNLGIVNRQLGMYQQDYQKVLAFYDGLRSSEKTDFRTNSKSSYDWWFDRFPKDLERLR